MNGKRAKALRREALRTGIINKGLKRVWKQTPQTHKRELTRFLDHAADKRGRLNFAGPGASNLLRRPGPAPLSENSRG